MTEWFLLLREKLPLQLGMAVKTLETLLMKQLPISIASPCYNWLRTGGTFWSWNSSNIKQIQLSGIIYFYECISSGTPLSSGRFSSGLIYPLSRCCCWWTPWRPWWGRGCCLERQSWVIAVTLQPCHLSSWWWRTSSCLDPGACLIAGLHRSGTQEEVEGKILKKIIIPCDSR